VISQPRGGSDGANLAVVPVLSGARKCSATETGSERLPVPVAPGWLAVV